MTTNLAAKAAANPAATEVATTTPKDVIARVRDNRGEFARALPAHIDPDRFVRVAVTALRNNAKLRECDPTTVLAGIMTAAQYGLEINDVRGQAYLIPRKIKGRMEANFQLGYRGLIDLAGRGGLMVNAQMVHQGDQFTFNLATLEVSHTYDLLGNRGPIVGYYSLVMEAGEARGLVVWNRQQAEEHRDRFASQRDYNTKEITGPWVDHFDAMALKSTIRVALDKMPLSVELRDALAHDGIAMDLDSPLPEVDRDTGEIIDVGEITHDPEAA